MKDRIRGLIYRKERADEKKDGRKTANLIKAWKSIACSGNGGRLVKSVLRTCEARSPEHSILTHPNL